MSELALFHAAERGDLRAARVALDGGIDPNTTDDTGAHALHVAAHGGFVDIVDILLVAGAVVDLPDATGCTPLHVAASQGHVHVVRRFVANKANVLARTSTGETPLHKAAAAGHGPIIEILLAHGADPHVREDAAQRTPLHLSAMGGHLDAASSLITGGADVNAPDAFGQTPLWLAASHGQSDVIDVLLGLGAELDARDQNGETPLMAAVVARNTEVVRGLLAMGANPNISETRYGLCPLHVAATNGDGEIAALLSAAGAEPGATDQAGLTPADAAAEAGHRALAERLRSGATALALEAVPENAEAAAGITRIPLDTFAKELPAHAGAGADAEAGAGAAGRAADWQARAEEEPEAAATLRFVGQPPEVEEPAEVAVEVPSPPEEPMVAEDRVAPPAGEPPPVAARARWQFTLPTIDFAALTRPLVRAVRWLVRLAALAALGIALALGGPPAFEWLRAHWPQHLPTDTAPAPPAQPKLPAITSSINDFANVLDPPTVRQIGELARDIKRRTGVEVAVVTVASTDPLDPVEYAEGLGARWSEASSDERRLLLLLIVDDSAWRIWMTPDLEELPGRLPISAALDLQGTRRIQRGNYGAGLIMGIEAIGETLARHRPLTPARAAASAPTGPRVPTRSAASTGLVNVTIVSRPVGATVRIDGGAPRGTTPLTLSLAPGSHRVELQYPGHVTLGESIRVRDHDMRYVFDLLPVLD